MKAVILAGGLGMRVRPFSEIIPKPLLPLGEKALLEVQIEHLRDHGVEEIFIATSYRSNFVKAYLGNGAKYGVRLTYSEEKKPLGTCGPLTLIKEQLTEPFLVMNGDILTKADLIGIYAFAKKHEDADLTIVTKIMLTPFRFGKVITENDYVVRIDEKPDLELEILAGMYVIQPRAFEFIPEDSYFGMDDLIRVLLANKRSVVRYLLEDYWIDIGQVEDYKSAVEAYNSHFKQSQSSLVRDNPDDPRR